MTELSALFRQYADTFAKDIATFDKARNLPCAIMGVGEVHSSTLKVGENMVIYRESQSVLAALIGSDLREGFGK